MALIYSSFSVVIMLSKRLIINYFTLYLKDNYPDWKEKFQEYEKRKSLEWKEVIELAKQKGEITQTVETEKIISSIRNIYLGLSYRSALSSQLSISELKEQIYTIYYLITKINNAHTDHIPNNRNTT